MRIGFQKQNFHKNKIRRPDKCFDPIAIEANKAFRGPPYTNGNAFHAITFGSLRSYSINRPFYGFNCVFGYSLQGFRLVPLPPPRNNVRLCVHMWFDLPLSFTSGFATFHNVSGLERLKARTPGEDI